MTWSSPTRWKVFLNYNFPKCEQFSWWFQDDTFKSSADWWVAGVFTGTFSFVLLREGAEVPIWCILHLQEGIKFLFDVTTASLLSSLNLCKILTTEFTVDWLFFPHTIIASLEASDGSLCWQLPVKLSAQSGPDTCHLSPQEAKHLFVCLFVCVYMCLFSKSSIQYEV